MKNNKKGFTLAELLVVVAIIGVLVAISIPIFSASLEKARVATDQANMRAAYAEASVDYLEDSLLNKTSYTEGQMVCTASVSNGAILITVASGAQSSTYTNGSIYYNGKFQ